jgi:hypothetical protein
MLNPTFDVEVAEPDTSSPESVVVPNPVEETERNDVLALLAALVEDAMERSTEFVLPYGLKMLNEAVPVVVAIPTLPENDAVLPVSAPSVTACESWYAAEVVECARPSELQ